MSTERFETTVLIVLDGWGHGEAHEHNAIAQANTPNWDKLWAECPHTLLETSGEALGLPEGQVGNSEVGHLHLGAGRLVLQDLPKINQAIVDGSFANNPTLKQAIDSAQPLHLIGLLSDGGVHSHQQHLHALIDCCSAHGLDQVFIHVILDGRDTPPRSAEGYLNALEAHCAARNCGKIASICGRYYAMDRDQRWERTQAFTDMLLGQPVREAEDALSALQQAYQAGDNDEFVQPTRIASAFTALDEQDSCLLFNFRADRMRQLANALSNQVDEIDSSMPTLHLISMTEYPGTSGIAPLFTSNPPKMGLGECVAAHNLPQLRIAETEKYAHVTFFFNGGVEIPFAGEQRELIPSPAVATYDLKPEMSAFELTDKLVAAIQSQQYALIVCNYANADMVGHSGQLPATIQAIEALDVCLGKVTDALHKIHGQALITADHGNAEMLHDPSTEQAHTAHTHNSVPLVYVGQQALTFERNGALYDVAPTLLHLLGLPQPDEMTGSNLLDEQD